MTLLFYDSTGALVGPMTGGYTKPVGDIRTMEVEIPIGQYPLRVDVTVTPPTVVLSDPPRDLVAEKLAELEARTAAAEDMALMAVEAAVETYEEVYPFLPQ